MRDERGNVSRIVLDGAGAQQNAGQVPHPDHPATGYVEQGGDIGWRQQLRNVHGVLRGQRVTNKTFGVTTGEAVGTQGNGLRGARQSEPMVTSQVVVEVVFGGVLVGRYTSVRRGGRGLARKYGNATGCTRTRSLGPRLCWFYHILGCSEQRPDRLPSFP